ncbi:MAG: acetyl-CoA carboxylase biotin carboxyl carrier protein [Ruminiclostridium sp.]|nr:acetyl-CoA carboxylase biotin carboxyl carrier protein [Ruminiclostridium sp.]
MTYEDDQMIGVAKEYIELMKQSGLTYFRVKNAEFEIELGERQPQLMPPPFPMPFPAQGAPVSQEGAAGSAKPGRPEEKSGNIMSSPIVGTFYSCPSPEKPAYVTVGKQVRKGDILFIIESMKLMNEVTSEYDGVVREIYVSDGESVEYGQPIMRIE